VASLAERNAAIVRLRKRGEPIGAIARRYSLCRERVEQIVRQAKREAVHG
jgi:DNA-binding NarL/FixJ family response regulator